MRKLSFICLVAAIGCGHPVSLSASRDGDSVRFVAHHAAEGAEISWRWAPGTGAPAGSTCPGDTLCTLPYAIGTMTVYAKRRMTTDSMRIAVP
jgi:hypothetical protein